MFFKKKEIKKEEVKQPTVIWQRLNILCKVLSKIQSDDKLDIRTHVSPGYMFIGLHLQSNLGPKYIELISNFCASKYVDTKTNIVEIIPSSFDYKLFYGNSASDKIFTIRCTEYTTEIDPYFNKCSLTAYDIDMAIHEIEEYIRNKYGTLEEIEKYNIQQIGILEGSI